MNIPAEDIVLIVGGVSVVIVTLVVFFFIIVIRYFRINSRKQKEIFEAVLNAQENERKRIAEDLHDEIGPMLSAIRLNIGGLNSRAEQEQITGTVKEAQKNLDAAIQDVRRISRNLVPSHIEKQGLTGAIKDYIKYLQNGGGVTVNFSDNLSGASFNQAVSTNFYRIIQELIHNAVRHGKASQININLNKEDNEFSIKVSDDGSGFITEGKQEGIGLKSIRSRVELYGGMCEWNSEEKKGTTFSAVFSLEGLK